MTEKNSRSRRTTQTFDCVRKLEYKRQSYLKRKIIFSRRRHTLCLSGNVSGDDNKQISGMFTVALRDGACSSCTCPSILFKPSDGRLTQCSTSARSVRDVGSWPREWLVNGGGVVPAEYVERAVPLSPSWARVLTLISGVGVPSTHAMRSRALNACLPFSLDPLTPYVVFDLSPPRGDPGTNTN